MTVFTLSSPDIPSGGTVPPHFEFDGFGCSGQNQSPILQWSGAPVGTQSFAVTVYDPDAPTGSGWWHWFVVDLPATTAQLVPNAGAQGGAGLPAGARQIRNDYGAFAWGGVCPPPGDKPHRYVFTVHALSVPQLGAGQGAAQQILDAGAHRPRLVAVGHVEHEHLRAKNAQAPVVQRGQHLAAGHGVLHHVVGHQPHAQPGQDALAQKRKVL